MKILLNGCYGGFGLSDKVFERLPRKTVEFIEDNAWRESTKRKLRTDDNILKTIYAVGLENASSDYADIYIANIPDNATDWMIEEYDGVEILYYVADGKIHRVTKGGEDTEWYENRKEEED